MRKSLASFAQGTWCVRFRCPASLEIGFALHPARASVGALGDDAGTHHLKKPHTTLHPGSLRVPYSPGLRSARNPMGCPSGPMGCPWGSSRSASGTLSGTLRGTLWARRARETPAGGRAHRKPRPFLANNPVLRASSLWGDSCYFCSQPLTSHELIPHFPSRNLPVMQCCRVF